VSIERPQRGKRQLGGSGGEAGLAWSSRGSFRHAVAAAGVRSTLGRGQHWHAAHANDAKRATGENRRTRVSTFGIWRSLPCSASRYQRSQSLPVVKFIAVAPTNAIRTLSGDHTDACRRAMAKQTSLRQTAVGPLGLAALKWATFVLCSGSQKGRKTSTSLVTKTRARMLF